MFGAVFGDVVGSPYEFDRGNKSKEFEMFNPECKFTDDTVMTVAVAEALLDAGKEATAEEISAKVEESMRRWGRKYINAGYGAKFIRWLMLDNPGPYGSFGNGSAMRISAAGWLYDTIERTREAARATAVVSHNHPEGIKGAEATAVAIYLAKTGSNILEIRDYINNHYYPMDFKLDDIRESYKFNETCQETVPQAIEAFLESNSFEDAIRNAISLGGDSDTLAAITGGIAEAYYGIPTDIRKLALTFLDEQLLKLLIEFENKYQPSLEKGSVKIKSSNREIKTNSRSAMIKSAVEKADDDLANTETKAEETSSQKLFNHLFEACNILRGPINQDEYKSYVTPILFNLLLFYQ